MLYLFDLDGTLISSYMDAPDRAFDAWQPLPGRAAKLQYLERFAGVAVITNQAGVAFGFVSEADVQRKLWRAALALGFGAIRIFDGAADATVHGREAPQLDVFVSYGDARSSDARYQDGSRRKPSGAMIREAIAEHAGLAEDGVLYVGDRPEDQRAAADAGVPFMWAKDFFHD